MDRIDLQVQVEAVPLQERLNSQPATTSIQVRERVELAREIQEKRYEDFSIRCNAELEPGSLRCLVDADAGALSLLKSAVERFSLSARGHDRVLKVARSIADLAGARRVLSRHVAEAVAFRGMTKERA